MPENAPPTPPTKRIRLIPWRGPLHWALLVATSGTMLLLPLLYGAAVAGLGCLWIWYVIEWAILSIHEGSWEGWLLSALPMFFVGGITWVFMAAPLWPKSRRPSVAIQITPGSQPRLFEMVKELCWHLRVAPPVEIWLDTTTRTRSCLRGGIWQSGREELVLHIGMPIIAVMSAREFAALLVRELASSGGGITATFSHAIRELDAWFYRALHQREPWQSAAPRRPLQGNLPRRLVRAAFVAWRWVALVPFTVFYAIARVISAPALWRLRCGAEKAAVRMAGSQAWGRVQQTMTQLDTAWQEANAEIRRGIDHHRLPENVALLVARHVTQTTARQLALPASQEAVAAPAGTAAVSPPSSPGSGILPHLPVDAPAASQLRGFVDLSRQVSYCYYQQELGLSLSEHRLVAEEEVLHQNRQGNASLAVIRRYFSGLAHPERAMCGQGARDAGSAGAEQLIEEIRRVRIEMVNWGPHLKSTLHEWNIAWQRRRDLEAAATLSLAGFSISRIQFGSEDTSPGYLHREATRQRVQMEQLESLLQNYEAKIESRFAAALGLLWFAEPDRLDPELASRRDQLSGRVSMYEAMAGALPPFRELLTSFFAFQTLGARFACLDDAGSFFLALQTIVPKMTNLVRQIVATMDGAQYYAGPDSQPLPLRAYLLQGELPATESLTKRLERGANVKALSAQVAAEASDVIAPFVDRFLKLYHETYAWLAESAEASEICFLGILSRPSGPLPQPDAAVPEEVSL